MLPLTINKDATFTLHSDTPLDGLNLTLVLTDPQGNTMQMEFTRDGDNVTTKFYASAQQYLGVHRLVLYKNYGESGQDNLAVTNFRLVPASEATRRTSDGGGEGGGGDANVDLNVNGDKLIFTKNGAGKEITVPYATKTTSIERGYTADEDATASETGVVRISQISNGIPSFPTTNNANVIVDINTHDGKYNHQLGFSSDGHIYHRRRSGTTFGEWGKLVNEGESIDCSFLKGYISAEPNCSSYLVSHPEANSKVLIPFIYNDIAFLTKRGGDISIYSTEDTDLTADVLNVKHQWGSGATYDNMFDGSPIYHNFLNPTAAEMNADGLIIDLTLPMTCSYGNVFYIDFGNAGWGFHKIDLYVKNDAIDNYVVKKNGGDVSKGGQYFIGLSHGAEGFNKIRIHLYDRTATGGVRIAQIGLIKFDSQGQRWTSMSRGIDDAIWRSITPYNSNLYSLGSSTNRWANIHSVLGDFSGLITASEGIAVPNGKNITIGGKNVLTELTLDQTPTSGSTNMVTSGGVYAAIESAIQGGGVPKVTKQYTNVIGTANNNVGAVFYFMRVLPTQWERPARIKYKIKAEMGTQAEGKADSVMEIVFSRNTMISYDVWNHIGNTSYRPYYYHYYVRCKQAGFNSSYGHLIGIGMQSSYNPTTASYARTFDVEIVETENCSITLFDTMTPYASVEGATSTNYESASTLDATTQGETHTGDRNNYDYVSVSPLKGVGSNGIKQYSIIMMNGDGLWESLTTTHGTGTSKVKNTSGFNLRYPIYVYYASSNISASSTATTGSLFSQYRIDLRYSTNCGTTLVANKEVYLVGTFGSDGLFYLDDTWWTQDLPTENDGKYYIFVGIATSTTIIHFLLNHEIYYHDGTRIRIYRLDDKTGGGGSQSDRDTTNSSKGYVHVPLNLVAKDVVKTYSDVTWVHGIESVERGISDATTSSDYNFDTKYFEGNPAKYNASTNPHGKSQYGKEERFPFATKPATSTEPARLYKSVRKAAPFIVLNTAKNRVYFKWQWNTGEWAFSDIYYDEWAEKPSDVNFDVVDGKVFAYMDKGVVHYIKRTNGVWEEPDEEKETKVINYLASDAFNTPDTIYEIAYDMDLNGNTIKPANGVVLKYAGGKIKNGTIDFSSSSINTSNPVIIDCPDVQFFENVKIIKSFSQVMKDVWFDDIWMAITVNPDDSEFACTAISLSKNHKVDFKHGEIAVRDKPARKLTIYGNGYKLTIDNTYRPSSGRKVNNKYPTSWSRLFGCSAIAIYDLTIELVDKTIQTYDSIFVSSDVFMKNVVYRGYSRLAANWDNDRYSLSALELHDCDLRATSFIFENSYNKVRFYNSQLRYLNPRIRHYYELISIGAYTDLALVENCNVEAYDTYIGGVWELGDRTKVDGVVNGYGYMKFHNCELVTFTTNNSQKTRGITDVIYEDCHFKTCDLPWRTSCIGTVTYKNCWFDIFGYQVGMTDAGPFDFWNIKSATFEGCTFNNTSFTDPEVTEVDGVSYPQGYTYPPYTGAIITIAPPESIVTSGTGDVQLVDGATWDFKLYLLNNRIMVNNTVISGYSYRPYSHFAIRTVNPNDKGAANKVILMDEQVKNMIVSRGNTFVHSISGTSGRYYESVGCHMYFNSRENVIPVDNTVFTVPPSNIAARDIDYENAYFGYCNTNFTFIDAAVYNIIIENNKEVRQYTDVPRYGRYNAATNKVAWLTYSAEEATPNS